MAGEKTYNRILAKEGPLRNIGPPPTGADPENLHGRWLTGWLPIVNHTGAKGVAG